MQSEIIIQLMTEDEAIEWENRVGIDANQLRITLNEGYEREAWRALGYDSWSAHLRVLAERFGLNEKSAFRLHSANENEKLVTHGLQVGQIPERQLRPLSQLETPDQKREVWQLANDTAPNGKLTSTHVQKVVQEFKATQESISFTTKPKQAAYITLDQWQTFSEQARTDVIQAAQHETGATFNQPNDNIEWARWSWNPITGCLHNCAYCYARDIANRFYEQGFAPSFIPSRLTAPTNTKSPDLAQISDPVERMGKQNVFVCSMADLFGKWVPAEWIESVLAQIQANPQWTFLLLTKFPVRMAEFSYPANVWLGTSVDYQWAVERAEKAFIKIKASGFGGVCWLSCEPMMEQLTFNSLDMFDWVVMGGSSASTQTPEYRPPFDDIVYLYNQARIAGCKVYQKTNLIPGMSNEQRIREYPGL